MPSRTNGARPHANPEPHKLPISQALVLGAIHGSAELLPISSSGHVALIPWLLDWDYGELDPELRKTFEVVLHAGAAAALLLALRGEVTATVRGMSPRVAALICLSSAPAAVAGLVLERPVQRHLSEPPAIAAGLLTGAIAMAWADRAPQDRGSGEVSASDALLLGIAQACALLPGVSRSGATLAGARLLRFTRKDSSRLSRHAALPVIAGATALKGIRMRRGGLQPGAGSALAAGALASFASAACSTWLVRLVERDRSLTPYVIYRIGLAGVVIRRLAREACD